MRKKIKIDKTLTGEEVRDSLIAAFPDNEIKTKNRCKRIFVKVSKRSGLIIVKYSKMLAIVDWNRGLLAKAFSFASDGLFTGSVSQARKAEIAKFLIDRFAFK